MNLRNWTKNHTLGMIIGFIGPLIYIPIILFIIAKTQNFYFEQLWYKFTVNQTAQGKFISLAIIPNLIWFYLFLNKEKYNFAMGIILGSALYLPYILYITFF
jgi:hypothetical protein